MTVDPQLAAGVRDALLRARFTAEGVLDRIGPEALDALGRDLQEPARRALAARHAPGPAAHLSGDSQELAPHHLAARHEEPGPGAALSGDSQELAPRDRAPGHEEPGPGAQQYGAPDESPGFADSTSPERLETASKSTAGTAVLDSLIRLFLVDGSVDAAALPAELAQGLVDLGLVERSGAVGPPVGAANPSQPPSHPGAGRSRSDADVLRTVLDVRPYGEPDTDWYVVSDSGSPTVAAHVLGLGGASLTLARITPRRGVRTVLDLGCGSGVQTLHAARHAQRVVATDTNPRALHLTELSALLSGLPADAVEVRQGSLFEPVSRERFDLVVSNPPFVISPGHRFTYRDAGMPGDSLSRAVVRGAAEHLAPGGQAALLVNWLLAEGQAWQERVGAWLDGLPVDAWVVRREVQDVAGYAATWLRDSGTEEADLDASIGAWLDEFAAHGAQAVGFGWVVLVAPGAELTGADTPGPWRLVEDLCTSPRLPHSEEVVAFLRGCAQVARMGVVELLGCDPRLSDGVRLSRGSVIVDGREIGEPPLLSIPGSIDGTGWRPAEPVSDVLLSAVLDSRREPLGERLDRAAAEAGLDPLDVLPVALARLRELIRVGIVRT